MSRFRLVAAIALGSVWYSISGAAQTAAEHPDRPQLFLERSYFAPLNPFGKDLLFEASAAAHFFLLNGMDWLWTRSGGWAFAVPVSFIPTVRMSTATSNPVRTPSYRVRLALQTIKTWPESESTNDFKILGVAAGIMHYSNGQAGCTYNGFQRDTLTPFHCKPVNPAVASKLTPNVLDGDFSTTFLPIAVNYRWGRLADTSLRVASQHTLGGELQFHPLGMRPGGLNRALGARYGHHQINLNYDHERTSQLLSPGFLRLGINGVYRTPLDDGDDWTTIAVELANVYDKTHGFGWFVRLHFGGDYYNIHFLERSNPLVTVGAIWDQNRLIYHNRTGRSAR